LCKSKRDDPSTAQGSAQGDAALFMDAYGVTANGNFEGKHILYRARDMDVPAAFAEAARVLKRKDYRQPALRNAEFLLENLRDGKGSVIVPNVVESNQF
jgi:uncharacterized protein YyaL (SSP411 family)